MTDAVDVDIEYLNAAGDGVARLGQRTLLIPFTIPGERVRVEVDKRGRGASLIPARLIEVLRPSRHRVTPGCRHFGPGPNERQPGTSGCGGCSWQHIAYPEQLRLKAALVARLLKNALRQPPAVRPTLRGTPGEPWGYRHKVHFVFGNGAAAGRRPGPLVMGHYARGSRRIVPIQECPVHAERGNRVAFDFFDAFRRTGVNAAASTRGAGRTEASPGVLRSIAVRVAGRRPEVMATLVVSNDRDARLRTASRRLMTSAGAPTALHLNIHPRADAFIFGRDTRTVVGSSRLREDIAGTSFLLSPTAFFQTNVFAAERLVDVVLEAIPADADVLDLYAGAGLFALPLAKRNHNVVAVEENRAAVEDGEASARLNRITPHQCRFVARSVESALASIRTADVVVLDPPREGCAPGVIEEIFGRLRPERVVYVSCNPEALVRDLHEAAAFRYVIEAVQPVDMFPHTAHVETVVTLVNRES